MPHIAMATATDQSEPSKARSNCFEPRSDLLSVQRVVNPRPPDFAC